MNIELLRKKFEENIKTLSSKEVLAHVEAINSDALEDLCESTGVHIEGMEMEPSSEFTPNSPYSSTFNSKNSQQFTLAA